MGLKTNNLKKILNEGINVFEFKEVSSLKELIDYSKINNKFTIRFDRNNNIHGLPFYKFDNNLDLDNIYNEALNKNCTLLLSNGYKYDDDLLFNFVIEIDNNNNFILELCDKKITLRDMYSNTTTIIKGNLFNKKFEYINKDSNKYTEKDIKKIVDFILSKNIKYHYLEGTLYDKNVGVLNKDIIIWQTN